MTIETIKLEDRILAIIVNASKITDERNFISPESFPLQVGIHNREKNTYIKPHEHLPFEKIEKLGVQEIFYVEKGKIEVGIYDKDKKIADRILTKGDLIILNSGHDVRFLENSKMIEVKQGPYRGNEKEKRYLT